MGIVKVYSEVLGREVHVPETPERIVSLAPAITETLFLLGLGERVVGVSHFCNKPEEARGKPRLGSYFQVNYEKLESLNPDLVLVTTGAQRRLALDLDSKGYTVYPIPLPVSLPGVIDMVVQVGMVTGEVDAARNLTATLLEKLSRLASTHATTSVYFEIDLGGPVTIGSYNYIDDSLARIGLRNVFSDVKQPWITNPDPSAVIERDPRVIVYEKAPYKPYTVERIMASLAERGLDKTRAFKEGRIIVLEPDSLAHYGPSLLDALAILKAKVANALTG